MSPFELLLQAHHMFSLFFNQGKYNKRYIVHKNQNTNIEAISIEINTAMVNSMTFDSISSRFILKVN